MSGRLSDTLIFLFVVGARFLVPLLIARFPLPATLACLVIDAADQSIFHKYTNLDLTNYQSYDKALDIFYLTVAYLSTMRNWRNVFGFEVARFLWYYRLVGVVLFELFEVRALLFVFPNTFEYYFIAYEAVRTGWDPRRLSRSKILWLAGSIWVLIKLPQEWWIHIAQNDFTDFVKESLFGVDAGDSWTGTIGNRPWVALVVLIVLISAVMVVRTLVGRLPERDWSTRFDVDKPVPELQIGEVSPAPTNTRWPVIEKIVLITLVATIFGQMLQLRIGMTQVLTATALIVVLNSALSITLARNGDQWRSLGVQFIVLAVGNTVILSIYASLVGSGRLNRAAALFFGVLLTLLIILYDRFRIRGVVTHPLWSNPEPAN